MSDSMCMPELTSSNTAEPMYYEQGAVSNQFTVPRIGPTPNSTEHSPKETKVLLDQERFLPIANVSRIMKGQIPSIGKIAKDAKELVQECVSEFISFITSEACERCMTQKRKTISADDLIDAIELLGFDGYVEPLRLFLSRYRQAHRINSGPDVTSSMTDTHRSEHYATIDEDDDSYKNNDTERGSPPLLHREDKLGSAGTYSNMTTASNIHPYMQHDAHANSGASTSHQPPVAAYQPATSDYVSEGNHNSNAVLIENQDDSHSAPMVVLDDGSGGTHAFDSEQMSLYIDPVTKQHYMIVVDENGTSSIYPVMIQGGNGPMPVVSMNEGGSASIQAESAVMNHVDGAAVDPKSMYVTSEYTEESSTTTEVQTHPVTPSRVQPKRSTRSHPYTRSHHSS